MKTMKNDGRNCPRFECRGVWPGLNIQSHLFAFVIAMSPTRCVCFWLETTFFRQFLLYVAQWKWFFLLTSRMVPGQQIQFSYLSVWVMAKIAKQPSRRRKYKCLCAIKWHWRWRRSMLMAVFLFGRNMCFITNKSTIRTIKNLKLCGRANLRNNIHRIIKL